MNSVQFRGLRGSSSARSATTIRLRSRGAIGARVSLQAGPLRQMAEVHAGGSHNSSNDPRLLFGLGAASTVEKAQVFWPGGKVQTLTGLAVDRYHTIRQPQGAGR